MKTVILMMTLLSCGCAVAQNESVIHGIKYQGQKLQVQVTSTGCTSKGSFRLDWQHQQLTIVRTKADNCRRMPHKIWLEFELPKEKSGFVLTNPFTD